jgi:hypothetical protein
MTKLLEEAMAKVSKLPEATQQSIAEDLIATLKALSIFELNCKRGLILSIAAKAKSSILNR